MSVCDSFYSKDRSIHRQQSTEFHTYISFFTPDIVVTADALPYFPANYSFLKTMQCWLNTTP